MSATITASRESKIESETKAAEPRGPERALAAPAAEIGKPSIQTPGALAYLLDTRLFEHLWRVATMYARSSMVPDQFRGKTDDCFVAVQLAMRMGCDPFMLMQNMYVVHGRPGIEAKLAIALANERGPFRDRIKFIFTGEGKSRACQAYAHDRQTGERLSATVTWQMVEAEGWNKDKPTKGNGIVKSKWNTLPDLMFVYRSAMFLIRMYCPEVLMGMESRDELEDSVIEVPSEPVVMDGAASRADRLAARLKRSDAALAKKLAEETARQQQQEEPSAAAPIGDAEVQGPGADPHAAVAEAAAAEVAAGPSGTSEPTGTAAEPPRNREPGEDDEQLDDPMLIDEYRRELAAATTIQEASRIERHASSNPALSPAMRKRITDAVVEKCRKIREGRGQKSSAGQRTIPLGEGNLP